MTTVTRLLPVLALFAASTTLQSQTVMRANPSGRAITEVGLAAPQGTTPAPAPVPSVIRIDYGQPHLRGRTLHTDSLVPYDKPWRLGANGNTLLTTDVDLNFGGTVLRKGAYVLYAVPGRSEWTLVVQRSIGQAASQYPDSATVARLPLRHSALRDPVESLTMWLVPEAGQGPARGELRFAWGVDQLATSWAIRTP